MLAYTTEKEILADGTARVIVRCASDDGVPRRLIFDDTTMIDAKRRAANWITVWHAKHGIAAIVDPERIGEPVNRYVQVSPEPQPIDSADDPVCFVLTYPLEARGNPDLINGTREAARRAFENTPYANVPIFLMPHGWEFQVKRLNDATKLDMAIELASQRMEETIEERGSRLQSPENWTAHDKAIGTRIVLAEHVDWATGVPVAGFGVMSGPAIGKVEPGDAVVSDENARGFRAVNPRRSGDVSQSLYEAMGAEKPADEIPAKEPYIGLHGQVE